MQRAAIYSLWVSLFILTAIVLAFAGLIPLGTWQPDEYCIFFAYRTGGLVALFDETFYWIPRPLSQALLYGYSFITSVFHRPFSGAFLLCCWAAAGLACLYGKPPLRKPVSARPGALWYRVLVAVSLFALFLSGHDDEEMFYWPMASGAYLPTLAAATLMLFAIAGQKISGIKKCLLVTAALLTAAGSSESGAIFSLYACLLLISVFSSTASPKFAAPLWMVSFFVSAGVLALVVTHRADAPDFVYSHAALHNVPASIGRACVEFFLDLLDATGELMTLKNGSYSPNMLFGIFQLILTGLAIKLLFFYGVRSCWRLAYPDEIMIPAIRARLAWFGAVTLLTCFTMLALSNYHYGDVCCSRQATFRQCFIILAIASAALYCARPSLNPIYFRHAQEILARYQPVLGPLSLAGAALLGFSSQISDIRDDYRHFAQTYDAMAENWQSGYDTQNDTLRFYLPHTRFSNKKAQFDEGNFSADTPDVPRPAQCLMLYFGKKRVQILPPK